MKRLSILYLIFCTTFSFAKKEEYHLDIEVDVYVESCTIHGIEGKDQPVTVDFNDINISEIATSGSSNPKLVREIRYDIDCGYTVPSDERFQLKFNANINSSVCNHCIAIRDQPSLALNLKIDNRDMNIGEWYKFSYDNKPELTVEPVTIDNSKITEGEFSATGVLYVEYD